jgi:2-haloacid dehalogenase
LAPKPSIVVFDLGGVLIDWNPRHLYRSLIEDEAEREYFLTEICSPAWNLTADAGTPLAEATARLVARHPHQEALIRAYFDRWIEMIGGPMPETVALLEALHARGTPLWAITNWSAETFALVRHEPPYAFLSLFRDIFVSGDLRMVKPEEPIFRHALAAIGALPAQCLFVDDAPHNVATAKRIGMHAHQFRTAAGLQSELRALGLLG